MGLMPAVAAVSDDRQQPRPRITVTESVEVTQRPQHRILHRVLRVVLVAQEIASESVRIVQMRQHQLLESLNLWIGHALRPYVTMILPFIIGCREQK